MLPARPSYGLSHIIGSRYVPVRTSSALSSWWGGRHIRPIVPKTFAFEAAEKAHTLLGQGAMIGRAALLLS